MAQVHGEASAIHEHRRQCSRFSRPDLPGRATARTVEVAVLGLRQHVVLLAAIGSVDRSNLAKYLTIAKLRLENAIAVVRSGDSDR